MMLLGRTVYGFGGESISVATSTLNSKWFRGKELALSFGINLAVGRLGSVANNWISPFLANEEGTPAAVWFGVLMNLSSVVCAVAICFLTREGDRQLAHVCSGSGDGDGDGDGLEPTASELLTEALLGDIDNDNYNYNDNDNEDDVMASTRNERHTVDDERTRSDEDGDEGHAQSHDDKAHDNQGHGLDEPSTAELDQPDTTTDEIIHVCDEANENDDAPFTSSSFTCLVHVRKFGTMFWLLSASCVLVYGCVLPFNNIASGILLERNYFTSPPSDCVLKYPNQCTSGSLAPAGGNPSFDSNGDACTMGRYSQPILPTFIHYNVNVNVNATNNEDWDRDSYDFDNLTENDVDCGDAFWSDDCTLDFCAAQRAATELSGKIMSIPYLLSATLSPFCGFIVDRIGLRAVIASVACIILICVHLSLALMDSSPVFPLIGQGIAYVCYAAVIWPSVPLTVAEECIGTAFGAMCAIQNVGLALFPLIIAGIYTASGEKYIPNVEYFFVVCALVGTIVGVFLNVSDRRMGGMLNKAH